MKNKSMAVGDGSDAWFLDWTRRLFGNPNINAEHKVIAWVVVDRHRHELAAQDYVGVAADDIAVKAGMPEHAASDVLADLVDMGLFSIHRK